MCRTPKSATTGRDGVGFESVGGGVSGCGDDGLELMVSSVWSSSSVKILKSLEMAVSCLVLVGVVGLIVLVGFWKGGSVDRIGKSATQAGPLPW